MKRPESSAEDLIKLAQEIPIEAPSAARIEEIRNVLLTLPEQKRRSRKLPLLIGGAVVVVAAAAAALIAIVPTPDPAPMMAPPLVERATIRAEKTAEFVHTPGSDGVPERVRLRQGTVRVEVEHLKPRERFIVATRDAEVEVRGTSFDVVAENDRLEAVRVRSGLVEVRVEGLEKMSLSAGETWERAKPVAPSVEPAPLPPPVISVPAKTPKRPRKQVQLQIPPAPEATAPLPVAPNERAFRDGWAAFARGDMEQAAELFAEAEELDPRASLAEDACYGRAVALERAQRKHDAAAEMRRFLEKYPKSVRADEVAVALGWLMLGADDVSGAQKLFRRASESPVSRVRRSAESGLEEIDRRRDLR